MEKTKSSGGAMELLSSPKNERLVQKHPEKIIFNGRYHRFEILGHLPYDLADLSVMIVLIDDQNARKVRRKINLFSQEQILAWCAELSEELFQDPSEFEQDIFLLADLLEKFREDKLFIPEVIPVKAARIPAGVRKAAMKILRSKNLFEQLDQLLLQAGIAGEEKNRLPLFLVALSYKFSDGLHAIIQGSSGSGKSHLMNTIATCFPHEDVISFTRISSKSLFHQSDQVLDKKLLLIQDYDGLEGSARFALRELQSAHKISQQLTMHDRHVGIISKHHCIQASFSSIMATTHYHLYKDNVSRSLVFVMDESAGQTQKVIEGQCLFSTDNTNKKLSLNAQHILQAVTFLLQPKKVLNEFASAIHFPTEITEYRRIHSQLLKLFSVVTWIKQFSIKDSAENILYTSKTDLQDCIQIFGDVLFNTLEIEQPGIIDFKMIIEKYLQNLSLKRNRFYASEISSAFNLSRSTICRKLDLLVQCGHARVIAGNRKSGFVYSLTHQPPVKELLLENLKKSIHSI